MSKRKVTELLLQLKSAKAHGKNYIKVKPHLVRHILRNCVLHSALWIDLFCYLDINLHHEPNYYNNSRWRRLWIRWKVMFSKLSFSKLTVSILCYLFISEINCPYSRITRAIHEIWLKLKSYIEVWKRTCPVKLVALLYFRNIFTSSFLLARIWKLNWHWIGNDLSLKYAIL